MRFAMNTSVLLWILQGLLALFFALGSGAPKLLLPLEALPMPIALPAWFVYFTGTAEVLGALGLVLPGVVRKYSGITPLAAACLVVLTICATVYQLLAHQPESALFAAVISVLCATVAVGRWRRLASNGRSARPAAAALAL